MCVTWQAQTGERVPYTSVPYDRFESPLGGLLLPGGNGCKTFAHYAALTNGFCHVCRISRAMCSMDIALEVSTRPPEGDGELKMLAVKIESKAGTYWHACFSHAITVIAHGLAATSNTMMSFSIYKSALHDAAAADGGGPRTSREPPHGQGTRLRFSADMLSTRGAKVDCRVTGTVGGAFSCRSWNKDFEAKGSH